MPQQETALAAELKSRIAASGPITFAEYMEACLYHPQYGYYTRASGDRFQDYYTSADVHPIFARLLARQIEELWQAVGRPCEFQVVELGAGGGALAAELLNFSEGQLSEFYLAMRYTAVERSSLRCETAAQSLARHISAGRAEVCELLPARINVGSVISNEFFDALPVHRVVMERGKLREIYIDVRDGGFTGVNGELSSREIAAYFAEQGIELREGQWAEVNLAARRWISRIADAIGIGFVVTVDYGHEARELYNSRHMRGTVLAYSGHRASENFYDAPGETDLTAHVNFTDLELCGAAHGLKTLGRVSQTQFLLALGRGNDFADLYDGGESEAEKVRARLKLKTLIHPEAMGETFSVMIQSKGIDAAEPTGLKSI